MSSISGTSNYMSNAEILEWMQLKTEDLYGGMRTAMQGANQRADAESDLNDIKAAIANSANNGGNADAAHALIEAALAKYKDMPEVAEVLQPLSTELNTRYEQAALDANKPVLTQDADGNVISTPGSGKPGPVTISSNDVTTWTKQIGDKVDNLGKQDSLDMINIQEFNNEINQAKQTASALMDSADKSTSTIINHIA
jgi:predicted lipoprotein